MYTGFSPVAAMAWAISGSRAHKRTVKPLSPKKCARAVPQLPPPATVILLSIPTSCQLKHVTLKMLYWRNALAA